ncbi:ABC transporter ATP-binding protein [Alkalihalobacillus trypoxylicola]|uniref:Sodium ABC transporter ATP-binding protein n=1 Tax=Alkalihalobacillus trypoxylicola TaxID=519424 RepID=A0A162DG31_9BACI|nr:ABC transporter ATP-binding protein [Alkalihalobacillus trypoxylicola]KYG29510.1 sodium ABC transporter ATP-binding protein [Alkalihalobacillus trypoxylicola]
MENVIQMNDVSKSFKEFQLQNMSFSIKKGFVTGFIGANGSGKTTILKMLLNLIKPDSGQISIFGLDLQKHEKEIKERIGVVFDENILFESMSIHEIKKIIAPAYGGWEESDFQYYLDKFELPQKQSINKFSKGMKMKASLAFALSHQAELLLMDEPTAGLDPTFRREFLQLLRELMLDENKSILFSSHITTDMDRIADYITFIDQGAHVFTKEFYQIEKEFAVVRGNIELLDQDTEREFLSIEKSNSSFEALTNQVLNVENLFGEEVLIEKASLEDIMYFTKRRRAHA